MRKRDWTHLAVQAVMMGVGIFLIARRQQALKVTITVLAAALMIGGLWSVLLARINRQRAGALRPLMQLSLAAFGLVLLLLRDSTLGMLPALIGAGALLMGAVQGIIAVQYAFARESCWWLHAVRTLAWLVLGALIWSGRFNPSGVFTALLGVYLMIFGGLNMTECLAGLIGRRRIISAGQRKQVRIGLPLMLSALIPSWLLWGLRRSVAEDDGLRVRLEKVGGSVEGAEVEVFIHLSDDPVSAMGHVDLAIGDTVYSYANYDVSSSRLLGGISDGVIAMVDKRHYIEHALESEQKILIGYRLRTGAERREQMLERLNVICPRLEAWLPPYALWEQGDRTQPPPKDGASLLYRDTHCTFWKVKLRKYRYFFGLNTNCVSFVDELLGAAGLDRARLRGTLSPGEYYAFLDHQLGEKGRNAHLVEERHIYMDAEHQRRLYEKRLHSEKTRRQGNA